MRMPAYAKINLYLDIMEKRSDGFHNIKSIMHRVSLCDYITVEKTEQTDNEITVTSDSGKIPSGDGNLVWKAAKLFFENYQISSYGVRIHIEKNIPVSAGLAGGSTDAATTLVILNEMYKTGANVYELCELGAKLGSDVPFCIVGGSCVATGRGEELDYLDSDLSLILVVAKGGEGVSTPAAYKGIDLKYGETLSEDFGDLFSAVNAVVNGDIEKLCTCMYNTFESVVLDNHAEAATAKKYMLSADGNLGAMLSGSGPSVFGIFNSNENAQAVKNELLCRGYEAFVCQSI